MPPRSASNALPYAGVVLASFVLYTLTLLPGIGGGDTAELQRVGATMGLAHSTGYPLYTLSGWLWVQGVPIGIPAWRMNLFSALAAALTVGSVAGVSRFMGHRRVVAVGVAATLAVSQLFWQQATQAEVYALASLLHILLIGAVLGWRTGRLPLWAVGLIVGLNLAHHRMVLLFLPGVAAFVALTRWPRWGELAKALAATVGPLLLYLYVPLKAAPWQDPWLLLRDYLFSDLVWHWLHPARLWAEGISRPLLLLREFVVPQFLVVGAVLALVGAGHLLWRDRALAMLLLLAWVLSFAFCCAYYVPDVGVFLFGAYLVQALLIGEGVRAAEGRGQGARYGGRIVASALLLLPPALFALNDGAIQTYHSDDAEQRARAVLAQPLPERAILAGTGDGYLIESLLYLQAVEGMRPDIELYWNLEHDALEQELQAGREVYLLDFAPRLGLRQQPEGELWRVTMEPPPHPEPRDLRWQGGIRLVGATVEPGPYRAGDAVPVSVLWEANENVDHAYSVFVHIVGPDGAIWGQQDRQPTEGPTSAWQPGTRYPDVYAPRLKPGTPPGTYRVLIGLYDYPSLERLERAESADGAVGVVGVVRVEEVSDG